MADDFQYLARAALIALVVAGVATVLRKVSVSAKSVPYVVAGVVLLALTVLTVRRAMAFASPVDLWRDTASKNPDSAMVYSNLGQALFAAAQAPDLRPDEVAATLDDAAAAFARAVQLKPDHAKVLANWGEILLIQGKPQEALEKFDRALAADPTAVNVWSGRGTALERLNKPKEAAESYHRGVAEADAHRGVWPRVLVATLHQRLAAIALANGDLTTARRELEQAIVVAPNMAAVHTDYAKLLARLGDRAGAATE